MYITMLCHRECICGLSLTHLRREFSRIGCAIFFIRRTPFTTMCHRIAERALTRCTPATIPEEYRAFALRACFT